MTIRKPKDQRGTCRVLIVSQWFDPEPTFKGLMFARALRDRGFDVQVLTGFPNYPGGRIYSGYRVRLYQREQRDGIDILRVPLYPSHDASGARRVVNYLSFALSASVAALLIRRPTVAYVYHPPATVGIIAQVLKYVRGVPFIYDVQDLWPDTLAATGMMGRLSVLAVVGRYMKSVYRSAARVVVLSPGFRRKLAERGVAEGKLDVIPNWTYELEQATTAVPRSEHDEFTVVYAGNVGSAQALDVVVGAALELENCAVRFVIVGDGLQLEALKQAVVDAEVDNIDFVSRRPATEMGDLLDSADALLVHLRDDPLFEITIPSKTQAYLRAGRPILMGVRGDAADLVEEAGAGIAFDPESAIALAEAVKRIRDLPPDARDRMGASGREYYEQQLALNVGVDRFSAVLAEASLHRPRYLFVKRVLDVFGASIGLIAAAVPMAVVALAIKASIGGPVLFTQERPGRDGRVFRMIKFRTMTDATDFENNPLPDRDRLTSLGRILRSTSVDELPELWNVLKGDMSLVGPRPLLMRYTPFFNERERLRLRVRPGVTGWAQVNGRNTVSWDDRLEQDVWYVENQSIRLDARIILRTVKRVLRSEGVVVDPESIMQNLDDERARKVAT